MKVSRRENLDRYYLWQGFGLGLFLHRIHHDEDEGVFHDHPWNGLSLIFGSYTEQYQGGEPRVRRWWNWIHAPRQHRVVLHNGPVWTLFFHFRRYNRWSVQIGDGQVLSVEPWRDVGGRTAYDPRKEAA